MTEIINYLLRTEQYERLLMALISWGLICPRYAGTLDPHSLSREEWEEMIGEALLDEMF